MIRKWYVAALIFGILVIGLFFIQSFMGRKTAEETQPLVCPEDPSRVLAEPQAQQEPEQLDPEEDVCEEPVPVSDVVAPDLVEEKKEGPSAQQLVEDLKDDDIPGNATVAQWELDSRLPDDRETVEALIQALYSGDRQQRQIAGRILASWAPQINLNSNRQFLRVMVEALCDDAVAWNCKTAASFLLRNTPEAADFLESALMSDDRQQRNFSAYILAISMAVPPESRTRVLEILGDFSDSYLPWEYRYGAWCLTAVEAQQQERHQNYSAGIFPDQTYCMKEGDSIWDIGWMYEADTDFLLMYNNLRVEDLEPGMTIHIPSAFARRVSYEHILYPGETLEDVARQYGSTPEEIMKINGITNPEGVKPGMKFLVPIPD